MLFLLPLHNVSQKSAEIRRPRNFRPSLHDSSLFHLSVSAPVAAMEADCIEQYRNETSTRGGASFIRVATRVIFPGNASVEYTNEV